ncbi:hypothetical protein PISMIDRAFT_115131, partial [Pisolithus microcarpus 441]
QISFTADVWSDSLCCPYLGMTACWIGQNINSCLTLEANLIAFHWLLGRHDGKALAKVALNMLDCSSVTLKVSQISINQIHLSVLRPLN